MSDLTIELFGHFLLGYVYTRTLRNTPRLNPRSEEGRMDHDALFARILQAVDEQAYQVPTHAVDPRQRAAMGQIAAAMRGTFDRGEVEALIHGLHAAGEIDDVNRYSALHVVAAHPSVADHAAAAAHAGAQEHAALVEGGPQLETRLASVDRHRGVVAFLMRRFDVALDHFTRALERERTAENVGNVLASLLRLGELDEARAILTAVERTLPRPQLQLLRDAIDQDPDLATLRHPAMEAS